MEYGTLRSVRRSSSSVRCQLDPCSECTPAVAKVFHGLDKQRGNGD